MCRWDSFAWRPSHEHASHIRDVRRQMTGCRVSRNEYLCVPTYLCAARPALSSTVSKISPRMPMVTSVSGTSLAAA